MDFPPETIPSALAVWMMLRLARCERRIDDIADALNVPKRKQRRGRALAAVILFTVALVLFTAAR